MYCILSGIKYFLFLYVCRSYIFHNTTVIHNYILNNNEKCGTLKSITRVRSRKGQINTFTRYMAIPAYMKLKRKKMHFAELLISWGEYYQCDWKVSPKRNRKKKPINTQSAYNPYLLSPKVLSIDLVKDYKKPKIKLKII